MYLRSTSIGLTNFWVHNDRAAALTLIQKFSADSFVSFAAKRKKPVWLRQEK